MLYIYSIQILSILSLNACIGFNTKTGFYQNVKISRRILSSSLNSVKIAVTRELGNNGKLTSLLPDFDCLEIPCIMYGPGPDLNKLVDEILLHDIIVISSPQVNISFEESTVQIIFALNRSLVFLGGRCLSSSLGLCWQT